MVECKLLKMIRIDLPGIYDGYTYNIHENCIEKFTILLNDKSEVIMKTLDYALRGYAEIKDKYLFLYIEAPKQYYRFSFFIGVFGSPVLSGVFNGAIGDTSFAKTVILEHVLVESHPRQIKRVLLQEANFINSTLDVDFIYKYILNNDSVYNNLANNDNEANKIALKQIQEDVLADVENQGQKENKIISWKEKLNLLLRKIISGRLFKKY